MHNSSEYSGRKSSISSDSLQFQLLDSEYNAFIKAILWPETSHLKVSDESRRQLAMAMTAFLEMTSKSLVSGAEMGEIVVIIRHFANILDAISGEISPISGGNSPDSGVS